MEIMVNLLKNNIEKFEFKGDREYLTGADIFSFFIGSTSPLYNLTIQFHKITEKKLSIQTIKTADLKAMRDNNQVCALLSHKNLKNGTVMVAVETEDNIVDRVPYNEEGILRGAIIFDGIITQNESFNGDFIDRIVALNKMLLNNIVEPNEWIFSRIDLDSASVNPQKISIKMERGIGGRIYQSSIMGDDKFLGTIYFSRNMA
jgi:hypothetical protein